MTIISNKCTLFLYFSIAYLNFAIGSTDSGTSELCPCLPREICPQTLGVKPEDEFYLGTILKCPVSNEVRCCSAPVEKMVEVSTRLSSVSESDADPEATTSESVNIVKTNQEKIEIRNDNQVEQTTALADESIKSHPTEIDSFETTTVPADDENTVAYVYAARNEGAIRDFSFTDITTDKSIDENQSIVESSLSLVEQHKNIESMTTENVQEMTTVQTVEASTEARQQSKTVESVNEAVSSTLPTKRSIVQRAKDRINSPVRRRYGDYRQHNTTEKSQKVEIEASNEQSLVTSIGNLEPKVVTQTSVEIRTKRTFSSIHPAVRNHGMMMMEVHKLLSNLMKNANSSSAHQESIPLTEDEHTQQLNELKQNEATPVIQTNRKMYGQSVNRFQIQTLSEASQENENVTQSEFVTTRRPKFQRRPLIVRNSLQTTQNSNSTTISTPITSIPLESSSSTVGYPRRKQYLQRKLPNGISTTLHTNSNETLGTVTESMPMTDDEKKQFMTNKLKMLFAARRNPPIRNATITTTPNILETDDTTEKVIPVAKVKASSPKRFKRPIRKYIPKMRVEITTEQEITAAIKEE